MTDKLDRRSKLVDARLVLLGLTAPNIVPEQIRGIDKFQIKLELKNKCS